MTDAMPVANETGAGSEVARDRLSPALISLAPQHFRLGDPRGPDLETVGEGRAAFREINTMLARGEDEMWIWPWCARLCAPSRSGR